LSTQTVGDASVQPPPARRRSARGAGQSRPDTVAGDLVRDAALESAAEDQFGHDAIVGVVTDMAISASPPLNVALYGPWGSGKSSFFTALEELLAKKDTNIKVARYDAWKYGGKALKLNFIETVAKQVGVDAPQFSDVATDQDTVTVDVSGFIKRNWRQLLVGIGLAVGVATLWFGIVSGVAWAVNQGPLSKALQVGSAGVGTVLGLALAALLVGPKVLESAVVKVTDRAPETDDQFAQRFEKLVEKVTSRSGSRLVVFIDELDRCAPDDVVATLIDLKTFLDVGQCVFIVAADREVLEKALRKVPQATPVRTDDPYTRPPARSSTRSSSTSCPCRRCAHRR